MLTVPGPLVDRATGVPLSHVMAAQTPQVFRAPDLLEAYRTVDIESAHDTAEVVRSHRSTTIAAVPGDPRNIKVTYPEDLAWVIKSRS